VKTDLKKITKLLDHLNLKYEVLLSDRSAILILPDYGRVLGMWSDIKKDNHFWINQHFLNGLCTRNWANPGGHRIWLAPEREYFISDLNKPFETYQVPRTIDPGNYKCERDTVTARLFNSGKLRAFASQGDCSFKITRTISLVAESQILEVAKEKSIKGIGYKDSVELISNIGHPAGLWSLIQVPLQSIISMPVHEPVKHTVFFGDYTHLISYKKELLKLRFTPKSQQVFKIGIKAGICRNVITCLQMRSDKSASLIMKFFNLGPERAYLDSPWYSAHDKGYAVQFFCGGTHGFGELETHSPVCLNSKKGFESTFDMHVYAFHGPQCKIKKIQSEAIEQSRSDYQTCCEPFL
jgi:hypothetical protein